MATEGTFVLADIGGYTKFLTGVGIEHAKEVTEHLLNRLIKSTDSNWKVANVMGDCVFFYSETPAPPADTSRWRCSAPTHRLTRQRWPPSASECEGVSSP